MEKELLKKEIIAIINVLPDDDLVLVNQMIKISLYTFFSVEICGIWGKI